MTGVKMKKGSLNVPFFQPVINPDGDTPESVLAKVKETGRLPDTDPGVIQALMRQMMELVLKQRPETK